MQRRRAFILLHVVVLAFGLTGVLGKLISLDALPLVWYRMGLAAVGLSVYGLAIGGFTKLSRKGRFLGLAVGALVAIHWVSFFGSIKASTVSVALVCLSTGAFITAIIEPIFYKRAVRRSELFLGLFAVAGMIIIFRFEQDYAYGIALGLGSAFLGSLFTVINGRLIEQHDPYPLSLWELAGGWIFLSPVLLITLDAPAFPATGDWVYLLILAWVCTAFAYVGSILVMKELTPFSVILTINLEPVYGIILAVLVFREEEQMSPQFYIGAALILASIFVDAILKRSQTKTT